MTRTTSRPGRTMARWLACLVALAAPAVAPAADPAVKPIKALLITGGCCHDYDLQKLILSEGTAARAHIEWTILQQGGKTTNSKIPAYDMDDWATGYDIVVHNECFSDVKDPKYTDKILKPHRDGLPAVVIHCAMHCYRDKTGEWFKFVGVTSHRHGSHFAFDVKNAAKDDPIMKGFGDKWTTPAGELYLIESLGEHCTPLAKAYGKELKKDEVCVWKNQYGKGRVFGTTIGHYSAEMADPKYLDLMARGIVWACDKPADKYLKDFDAEKTKFRWEEKAREGLPKPETAPPPVAKEKK